MGTIRSLSIIALFLFAGTSFAQCLTNFTTPAGQTPVSNGAWFASTVPSTTWVHLNVTTTAGSTTANVAGCNAMLISNNAPVSGPNVPPGTTVVGGVCPNVTLSAPATTTGTAIHTFTLPAYINNYPPSNPGIPMNTNCSVCPSLFTAPTCAGEYFSHYMCIGNIYTFSLCGSSTSWNSTITITNSAGTNQAVGIGPYDDDGCGTTSGHATTTFVPAISGMYRVRVFEAPCEVNAAQCGIIQVACSPAPDPPANDEPTGAVQLIAAPDCLYVNGTTAWATNSSGTTPAVPSACGTGCTSGGQYAGFDVWYAVEVPASGNVAVHTELVSAGNIALTAYSGTPGNLTQLGGPTYCGSCNDDQTPTVLAPFLLLSGLAPGSTLYLRVWPNAGMTNMGTFRICAVEAGVPANDTPCDAIDLPVGATCEPMTISTMYATSNNPGMTLLPATPTCGSGPLNDVWMHVVVPASGSTTLSTLVGSLDDLAMAVYTLASGTPCAGTLSEIACADANDSSMMPALEVNAPAGTAYFVRLWSEISTYGTFSICAYENLPPPNDEPCGAIELTVITGCLFAPLFSNDYATNTASSAPGVLSIPAPTCNAGPYASDVWFTAVVPPSGQLFIDTDNSQLVDAAMAVYTATGTCIGGDLELVQVASANGGCTIGGSLNGAAMPATTVTGLAPGTTVYVRIWRQTGADGTFLICARDPAPPSGDCFFTLRMSDMAGDGWNGDLVTVCVDATCTDYTVAGSHAYISFPAQNGQEVSLSYTPSNAPQSEVVFVVQANSGGAIYTSTSPPTTGEVFSFIVNDQCNIPLVASSDCLGAIEICDNDTIALNPSNTGSVNDLSSSNDGCMANENQGAWFTFTTNAAGTMAFSLIIPSGTDYDLALWGPYGGIPPCPPDAPPLRCTWSGATGTTGLNYTSTDLSEGAGGDRWVRYIDALPAETYLMYVDNWSRNGLAFELVWNNVPTTLIECVHTGWEDRTPDGNAMRISPNPASDHLLVTNPFDVDDVRIEVIDAAGRTVVQQRKRDASTITLPLDAIGAGLYVVRVSDTTGRTANARFVKE